jgi:hypothetical protein
MIDSLFRKRQALTQLASITSLPSCRYDRVLCRCLLADSPLRTYKLSWIAGQIHLLVISQSQDEVRLLTAA